MSLNGLDAPAIAEAARALQTNPSSWLLLKYITRDEVELYGSGNGGPLEAASKIDEYKEKSPLYGLVGNNGTKVLVKYLPEGTSRLLQARVKVHFEALEANFPHDSEVSISSAAELTGGALGPIPSASSSSPAPFPAQSASVAAPPVAQPLPNLAPTNSTPNGDNENLDVAKEEEIPRPSTSRTARLLADVRAGKLESHEVLAALKITPSLDLEKAPSTHSQEWPERKSSLNNEKDPLTSTTSPPTDLPGQLPSPRRSSGSNTEPYFYKPKTELAPRPSQAPPDLLSSGISTLPAGISIPLRSPRSPSLPSPVRPTSSQTANVPFRLGEAGIFPIVQSPASVIPASYIEKERPKSRAGSVVTLPANYGSIPDTIKSPRSPKDIPQEKLRLMKALELRRKQQARERAAQDTSSAEPSPRLPSSMESSSADSNGVAQVSPTNTAGRISGESPDTGFKSEVQQQNPSLETETIRSIKSQEVATNIGSTDFQQQRQNAGQASAETSVPPPPPKSPARAERHRFQAAEAAAAAAAAPLLNGTGTEPHLPQVPETSEIRQHEQGNVSEPLVQQQQSEPSRLEPVVEESETKQPAPPANGILPNTAVASVVTQEQPQQVEVELKDSTSKENQAATAKSDILPSEPKDSQKTSTASEAPASISHNRPNVPRLHSKDVSISASLSSASLLDELDGSTVEEAQPVTFVKSPVTPTISNPFESELTKSTITEVPMFPEQMNMQSPEDEEVKKGEELRPVQEPSSKSQEPPAAQEAQPISQQQTEGMNTATMPKGQTKPPEDAVPKESMATAEPGKVDAVTSAQAAEASASKEPVPIDSAVTSPSASEDRSTPLEEGSPNSTVRGGGSPPIKKHPTVNPPHIWGGPLRAASNSSGPPPRHLSPAPDLQRLNRSASIASSTSTMLRPDSPSGVKKTGVGSRIADRIKALEKSSGGGQASSGTFITPSSVSVKSRKSSFNTPPGSSGTDAMRKPPYPTPSPSPGSNIFTRRFGSVRGPGSEAGWTDNTVRPTQLHSSGSQGNETTQRPTARPTYLRQQSSESRSGESSSGKKQDSKSPSRDGALGTIGQKRGSFSSHRLSFSGKRESTDTVRTGHSRQSSVESTGTGGGDKTKDNKAKKLLKRMTGAFSPRKDKHGSASLSNEPIMEGVEADSAVETQPADLRVSAVVSSGSSRPASKWNSSVVVGEVNIQFPDTLLWKRRHMELDGEGYIVLLPSASDRSSRVASKKYHMSEFHPPYIPDQEREELPYSVILDFMDSSTLQCACQNSTDQTNVLHALTTVHSAFMQTTTTTTAIRR